MYYLHLYSDSYTPHADLIEIDSLLLPRPGDVIDTNDGTYLVFDVTHRIDKGKMLTVVSAREASRNDRFWNFIENGYLDTREDSRHGELIVDDRYFDTLGEKLPDAKVVRRNF